MSIAFVDERGGGFLAQYEGYENAKTRPFAFIQA